MRTVFETDGGYVVASPYSVGTKFSSNQRPSVSTSTILNGRQSVQLSWTLVEITDVYQLQIDRLTEDGEWEQVLDVEGLEFPRFQRTDVLNVGKHRGWLKTIHANGLADPQSLAHHFFVA